MFWIHILDIYRFYIGIFMFMSSATYFFFVFMRCSIINGRCVVYLSWHLWHELAVWLKLLSLWTQRLEAVCDWCCWVLSVDSGLSSCHYRDTSAQGQEQERETSALGKNYSSFPFCYLILYFMRYFSVQPLRCILPVCYEK